MGAEQREPWMPRYSASECQLPKAPSPPGAACPSLPEASAPSQGPAQRPPPPGRPSSPHPQIAKAFWAHRDLRDPALGGLSSSLAPLSVKGA